VAQKSINVFIFDGNSKYNYKMQWHEGMNLSEKNKLSRFNKHNILNFYVPQESLCTLNTY
jgi:hypothetical protein